MNKIVPATESEMQNIKDALAVFAADLFGPEDRLAAVKEFLLLDDDDEARELIARGRRLVRRKAGA